MCECVFWNLDSLNLCHSEPLAKNLDSKLRLAKTFLQNWDSKNRFQRDSSAEPQNDKKNHNDKNYAALNRHVERMRNIFGFSKNLDSEERQNLDSSISSQNDKEKLHNDTTIVMLNGSEIFFDFQKSLDSKENRESKERQNLDSKDSSGICPQNDIQCHSEPLGEESFINLFKNLDSSYSFRITGNLDSVNFRHSEIKLKNLDSHQKDSSHVFIMTRHLICKGYFLNTHNNTFPQNHKRLYS